jgi:hypothetical protein
MIRRRSKALWAIAALLLVNATLLVAQPALALPRALGSYFFGSKLVRAEVLVQDGGSFHHYRIDRGVIRDKVATSLVLRERDGTVERIAIAPDALITLGSRVILFERLRKGMRVTVIREGEAPAIEVRATR